MQSNKIKVGIFTKPIDDGKSGSGSHLFHLLTHVFKSSLIEQFDITLVHYKKGEHEIYHAAKDILISRNPLLASFQLKKQKFDILHYSPLSIFSPIFTSAKRVATIHGDAQNFLKNFYSFYDVWHKHYVVRNYARKMDYIFTVSNTSKKYLVDEYGIGKERIAVTHNAVSDDFARLDSQSVAGFRSRHKLTKPFIFHLSRFSERKNPWTLLRAFSNLVETNKNIELVIGGYGWDNIAVKSFLRERKLESNVRIVGFLSIEDINYYFNSALLFIFPSLYEGYGMPNLEAMKCGCPVITSNVFAIPEVVQDSAIMIQNPTDHEELTCQMARVIADEDLQKILRSKGLENVKRFDWQKSADCLLESYMKLCVR